MIGFSQLDRGNTEASGRAKAITLWETSEWNLSVRIDGEGLFATLS